MFWKKKSQKAEKAVKKGSYVVVLHKWFVHSISFDHFEFNDITRDEVEKEAKILCSDKSSDFVHCAYYIIEVES